MEPFEHVPNPVKFQLLQRGSLLCNLKVSGELLCNMQSCPELASEAVDYVEATTGGAGLGSLPPPIVILALDTTAEAEQLEMLKAATVEVSSLGYGGAGDVTFPHGSHGGTSLPSCMPGSHRLALHVCGRRCSGCRTGPASPC